MSATIVVGFDPDGTDDGPLEFGLAAARFTGAPLVVAAVYAGDLALDRLADGEFSEEMSSGAREALAHWRARDGDLPIREIA